MIFQFAVFLLDFFGELVFCDCDDFFFIGDPILLFFDEGLDDFELLDVFLADVMIG